MEYCRHLGFDYMSLLCKADNHKITPEKPDTFDNKFYEFLYEVSKRKFEKFF